MKTHRTFCALRFGDNIAHLLLLRRLAKLHPGDRFVHYARQIYHDWLREVVEDLPNVALLAVADNAPWDFEIPGAVNAWKGAGNHWQTHPNRNDYVEYFVEWYAAVAGRLGLESPIRTRDDFLFDYPALQTATPCSEDYDFLVVNHRPMSGQFQGFSAHEMDLLCDELASAGHKIITTQPSGLHRCTGEYRMTATGIGNVSIRAKHIVMVSTGPSWPTFNLWNRDSVKLRVVLIDHERVNIAPNTEHAATLERAREILVRRNLL